MYKPNLMEGQPFCSLMDQSFYSSSVSECQACLDVLLTPFPSRNFEALFIVLSFSCSTLPICNITTDSWLNIRSFGISDNQGFHHKWNLLCPVLTIEQENCASYFGMLWSGTKHVKTSLVKDFTFTNHSLHPMCMKGHPSTNITTTNWCHSTSIVHTGKADK